MSKNKKHYYAVYSPYGTRTLSEEDTLMMFETEKERDNMVEHLNRLSDGYTFYAEPVTLREVAHRFDVRKFWNDPWGVYCREVPHLKTCAGRNFFEISQRPNYKL